MINSTEEFLELFRTGNYFFALLEWREYLLLKYSDSEQKDEITAKYLSAIILYELINHGFSIKDITYIENLYNLVAHLDHVEGNIQYLTSQLSEAACYYQVYLNHFLHVYYQSPSKLNAEEIIQFMQNKEDWLIQPSTIEEEVSQKLEQLEANKELFSSSIELKLIKHKQQELLKLKVVCEEYAEKLEICTSTEQLLRLGLLKSLIQFLSKALPCSYTTKKINQFVEEIRSINVDDWEEVYLDKLVPRSMPIKIWNVTKKNSGLFFRAAWGAFVVSVADEDGVKEEKDEKAVIIQN